MSVDYCRKLVMEKDRKLSRYRNEGILYHGISDCLNYDIDPYRSMDQFIGQMHERFGFLYRNDNIFDIFDKLGIQVIFVPVDEVR